MARRKQIRSKQQFDEALELEKSGDTLSALKLYQKAVTIDPSNSHAWNRQMVLFRKSKTREQEVELIKTAIGEYQKSAEAKKHAWMEENREKADSSRELAKVLGLLEETGLPKGDDTIIEKWQTRLYLLEYRIRNARKKKISPKNPNSGTTKTAKTTPKQKTKITPQPNPTKKGKSVQPKKI